MTGRYPLTLGMQYGDVDPNTHWGLNETETLISQVLKSKGKYTNYALGKWNIGHFSSKLLPTARGFDYYLGYQAGSTTYWSKFHPDTTIFDDDANKKKHFLDLTYGDNTCYAAYDGDDKHDYSTWFYKDKAVNIIKHHQYEDTALFLYVSFQAVHDPYEDIDFPSGVPRKYVSSSIDKEVTTTVVGRKRRQLALSLNLLDSAVEDIVNAVDDAGQSESTYFVFTSDNGGCYLSGASNGPLRGNKGTLFEGGTKVNAFIYSSKFSGTDLVGITYGGLMHVTDWFPTILSMADVNYSPPSGYELDGVSHWSTILALTSKSDDSASSGPRDYLLYNYYTDIKDGSWDNPVRAVRNTQYKLIDTMADNDFDGWNDVDTEVDDDDQLDDMGTCTQYKTTKSGTYTSFLFDLINDPYETTNLYDDDKYSEVIEELQAKLKEFKDNSRTDVYSDEINKMCFRVWKAASNVIVPWTLDETSGEGYPTFSKSGCDYTLLSPLFRDDDKDDDFKLIDDDDFEDTRPTTQPTHKPSHSPTHKPTHSPTHKPTHKPTHSPTHKPTK
jgi:arylsulfatase A-like enzyme